jgi:hypothetical protein
MMGMQFMPDIPGIQEATSRRIAILGQPGAKT